VSNWSRAADAATDAAGQTVLLALAVWVWNQHRARRGEKERTTLRDWEGYVTVGGVTAWRVRVAERPDEPSARVMLEVLDDDGTEPDPNKTHTLRQQLEADRMLAKVPSPEQYEFLKTLTRKRRKPGHNSPAT